VLYINFVSVIRRLDAGNIKVRKLNSLLCTSPLAVGEPSKDHV